MRLIIVVPELHRLGGIANHYLGLSTHWSLPVRYLFYGKRNDHTPKLLSLLLFPYDVLHYILLLLVQRKSVVLLNPSLRRSLVLRDALMLLIARLFRHRVVVFVHGFSVDYADSLCQTRRGRLFAWCYNKASFIYVLYSGFRKQLQAVGITTPILLTTTKVSDELLDGIELSQRDSIRELLFVARIVPEKGIFITLQTFEQLKIQHPDLRLRVCGDGPALADAKRYVSEHNLRDVFFEGNVTGCKLRDCYLSSDLYILPTLSEGMATTVLEAMAFGLPVISRPVGGVQDFWSEEDMGVLTPSLDPADYALQIEMLMNDADRLRHISSFNHQYAREHFLASSVTRRFEDDLRQQCGELDAC